MLRGFFSSPCLSLSMTPSTFCNLALSTSYNPDLQTSALSLDWIMASGISVPRSVALVFCRYLATMAPSVLWMYSIMPSPRSDIVLGCDWVSYCRDAFPNASFVLTSRIVGIHSLPSPSETPGQEDCNMHVDGDLPLQGVFIQSVHMVAASYCTQAVHSPVSAMTLLH
ncbi:hypothetical protein DFH07DRAFT_345612 [Mycena maculata]|uniref:Uncharacterized protein n=1 Tax=Mycena maculata TaxID=230809 RepID=A0AAD7JMR6_9AGAR|nr:hypothetical protein DFH07DRAFT_345612 [Mycena maculata]